MALNLDFIGKEIKGEPFSYDEDMAILYALGIGAGADELDLIYEKNLKVIPSFCIVPAGEISMSIYQEAGINLHTMLHGEQGFVFHKPLAPRGVIHTTGVLKSIYDKGDKGAVLNFVFKFNDSEGDLLADARAMIFDRSGGNFGGDRGHSAEPVNPPEGVAPDFIYEYKTFKNQAALYRLSGDKNPMHIDPEFGKMLGLNRPILHGMCSYGISMRGLLNCVADGNPHRVRSYSARFKNMVFPGDTLITKGWKTDASNYVMTVINQDGKTVLGNAMAEAI